MREKLETLPLAELKKMAAEFKLGPVSKLRKNEVIDLLVAYSEKLEQEKKEAPAAEAPDKAAPKKKKPARKPAKKTAAPKASADKAEVAPAAPEEPAEEPAPAEQPKASRQPKAPEQPKASEQPKPADVPEEPAPDEEPAPAEESAPESEEPGAPKRVHSPFNSGEIVSGVLELAGDFGFLRGENYLTTENDIYVGPQFVRRFNLKTGDYITGMKRIKTANEKFAALLYITDINGIRPNDLPRYRYFERMTPVFPHERLHLETEGGPLSMRIMDLMSPIGKGQRGMIVSPPKAGKTTLLKQTASAILQNNPEVHLIVLLIDERPEEVTDIKESLHGENLEVIYSTFDEMPEHHKRVAEMVLARAKYLVECHQDVVILLDSITRLARAYNLLVAPSGRTLSGGLDPTALYAPKQFFGAARCMREGGSMTVLATALVETGSRMDDMIFEEFKGTGNMELVLDRGLSERRVFPAIDVLKSGTRRDDLLLSREEYEIMNLVRRYTTGSKPEEAGERIRDMFAHTRSNREFLVLTHRTFGGARN